MTDTYQLWEQWRKKPDKNNLSPLLNQHKNIINRRVTQFNLAEVPRSSMEIEAKKLAVEAYNSYNPTKDASLDTHVYTHLKRLSRYVGDLQNTGKIPENRRLNIYKFRQASNLLEETLGREPSIQEVASELRWPMEEVERMENELRGTTLSSVFEGELYSSDKTHKLNRIVKNIYYELTPEEQVVYEHLLGIGGKKKLNETQIAHKLHMSPTKISRIKKKIGNKIQEYT